MRLSTHALLLAALAAGPLCGQDINLYSTTLFQYWNQSPPGFDKSTCEPATQFLSLDATGFRQDSLSFHFLGWGRTDLADQSRAEGKTMGEFSYGYMKYRGPEGNLEAQLGRFAVNQGMTIEQVDGASFRADLIGGFTFYAFGGKPVLYRTSSAAAQQDYDYQRDVIFGGRLGKRFLRIAEVGLLFLQDGSTPAKNLNGHNQVDYTRRQLGVDLRLTPHTAVDFTGRTVFDIAAHMDPAPGTQVNTSRIAEHDYNLGVRISPLYSVNATYTQRNYQAYYAGSIMPSLFNPNEMGAFRSQGLYATLGSATSWQGVVDYKRTHRDSYGDATRFGGELRRYPTEAGFQYGFGFHRVNADNVPFSGAFITSYGLSYRELRAWVMYEKQRFTASLDGIHHHFDDADNPNLNGQTSVYEVVASLGYQATPNFKVSGDLIQGVTPLLKKETMALLRADYHFGMALKGGKP